jgi:hypothetical protein
MSGPEVRYGCAGGCGEVWEGADPAACSWNILPMTGRPSTSVAISCPSANI